MTESEIRDLRRKLDDQYNKDRETLDRMLDFMLRSKGAAAAPAARENDEKPLTINERVANYVFQIETNFTMQDAWKFIKDKDPEFGASLHRQAMSTALWKMKKAGEIKIIIPKKGKLAAVYALK